MYTVSEGSCAKMLSEAKKKGNQKWDAANLKGITIKLTNDVMEEFRRICELNGDTPYSVLRKAVDAYIEQNKPM